MNTILKMSTSTLWQGQQFLEYFTSLVSQQPLAQVRIVTYLISYEPSGVLHDLYKVLNNRSSCIHVGTTRHVSQRSIERELKAIKKHFPRIKTRIVYNDHRKIFYIEMPQYNGAIRKDSIRRAWIGSQNLCHSFTKNLVLEVPPYEIDNIRLEIDDLKTEPLPYGHC